MAMPNLVEQYSKITNLREHLIKRVDELRKIKSTSNKDTLLIDKTITTNIEMYESAFGAFPFPNDPYNIPTHVDIGDKYVQ